MQQDQPHERVQTSVRRYTRQARSEAVDVEGMHGLLTKLKPLSVEKLLHQLPTHDTICTSNAASAEISSCGLCYLARAAEKKASGLCYLL